ncbi:hypothetical protein AgCh_021812 [Apium graveolens]
MSNNPGFWRKLSNLKIPVKVKHFLWQAVTGCLPTKDALRVKKGGNLQNRTGGGWRPRGTSGVRMRKGFEEKKGKVGIMQICLCGVGLLDYSASGRLGCVRVLSDPDRRNVLDPGYLGGGDVATCPGLLKVNAECVRVLSDPDRRNVLDPGNLDGGDAATCPGILCLGPGPLQLGLTYYGLSFAPHSLMRVYPDGGVE